MSGDAKSVVVVPPEIEIHSANGAADTAMEMDNGEVAKVDMNVSASEESKGGIKYEVLLGEAKPVTPLRAPPTSTGIRPISAEVIQMKIDAATKRRHSLEAERLAALTDKLRKIDEVAKKREEEESKFSILTKENLEQKIETSTAKRETIISDLKTKLSTHNTNHLQEVRQNMATNLNEFEEKSKQDLLTKLEVAEKNREKVLQEKLESLKKHDEKVEQVRSKRGSMIVTEDITVEMETQCQGKPAN